MKGEERRKQILRLLADSKEPIPGTLLAQHFHVSRQVIVQDVALLRTAGNEILSMKQGYLMQESRKASRIFKAIHSEEQVEEELSLIVDLGGTVKDVFVSHKAYGLLRADLDIKSRLDVELFVQKIVTGKSTPLMNVTSGYHYHTVIAESEELLDMIQERLEMRGFLAELQDYEPVPFS